MNLAHNPTETQLTRLLAEVDDSRDSHILWVDETGEVHLDPVRATRQLSNGQPVWLGSEARFRSEPFPQGGNYVGRAAAKDAAWINHLFREISHLWNTGFRGNSDYWKTPA